MITKSDTVILFGSSALLLVALLRVGGPESDTRNAQYSNNFNQQYRATAVAQNSKTTQPMTVTTTPVENETPVVSTQTVSAAEVGTEDFKQPDVIREAAFTTHVVKQGEYLGLIARRYNTSVSELKQLNNLTGNTILVGQKLVYPAN